MRVVHIMKRQVILNKNNMIAWLTWDLPKKAIEKSTSPWITLYFKVNARRARFFDFFI